HSNKSQMANKPYLPAHQVLDFVAITRTLGARDRKFEVQMASKCAESDPFAAANFFSQPLPDGTENDFAELKIVSAQWIRRDPEQAENWVKGQEDTPPYEVVAGRVAHGAPEPGAQ